MQILIYSKISCIASNDFIKYCTYTKIPTKVVRLLDKNYPSIPYDITLLEVENIHSRKFYTSPVIFIDDKFINSIKNAQNIIKDYLNATNIH